ncbi:glycopeptide antibiotics resistance protein [Paenibacillus sp. V4I9]|uniref:VanZ family protein n=1 Tax=unclassified Paenibacillus TaxID=185978 RepID=UPI002786F1A6|nr:MULTISPECIES: VanZ family protein [unclassified Paenibacillus]MDQ0888752.1 glycopeptide antibiotics resistance protein [Paenibacillus sp. V4I9]MDQ0899932.1 glycopeptide antibiotics resistance protein [Paenibacillus sp. V4I7]
MLKFTSIGLLLMIMYLLAVWFLNRKRAILKGKLALNLLFFVYILAVVAVTLFPIPIDNRFIEHVIIKGLHQTNNFIPFKTITDVLHNRYYMVALKNIGGNILLLMPLGLFIPLIWGGIYWKRAVFVGFTSSFIIELTQAIISLFVGFTYRSSDVDDIILNTIGLSIGYACSSFLIKLFQTAKNSNKATNTTRY